MNHVADSRFADPVILLVMLVMLIMQAMPTPACSAGTNRLLHLSMQKLRP